MPTLSSIKYNQKIKVFYDRLVSKHKPKKVAVIACMRKLLLIAHTIYKNKTVSDPTILQRIDYYIDQHKIHFGSVILCEFLFQ